MVIFKLLAQSCGLLGCWVIDLNSTYGQSPAASKARPVSRQRQRRECSVTYIHLAEVEWHSWTSHAAWDQMSTLVAVFLQAAHGASGWAPVGQMGRQCVVVHCIVESEQWLQRSFLNQQGTRCPEEKSSVKYIRGMNYFLSTLQVTSCRHTRVLFCLVYYYFHFIPKATPLLSDLNWMWPWC